MHGVILAAGEGRRMGPYTADVPKAFIELDGRTLYDRQRAAMDRYVDEVTVVLGYQAETAADRVGDARTIEIPDWRQYDNAESLRRALRRISDDVLVMNGDIVVTTAAIGRLVDRHSDGPDGRSLVACIPGTQTDSTAIRCDGEGIVTDYGMIAGHRHAGLGVVDRAHGDAARSYLSRHRTDWYPGIYPEIETEMVPIPADQQIEMNEPGDLAKARSKLPLATPGEQDLQT